MPNHSTVSTKTISQSNLQKRPLTSAYTFKLKAPSMKKKKQDPVSLFQQASKAWKQDKFLTNRANNKEGRKLNLDKRNKAVNKTWFLFKYIIHRNRKWPTTTGAATSTLTPMATQGKSILFWGKKPMKLKTEPSNLFCLLLTKNKKNIVVGRY